MSRTHTTAPPDELRERLDRLVNSFDAGVPPAFARAMQSFLTALDYDDAALMRSHMVEAREALVDVAIEAVRKCLAWSQVLTDAVPDVLADADEYAPDEFDELGQYLEASFDRVLTVLTGLRDGLVATLLTHKIDVPNAGQLRGRIDDVAALKASVLTGWPWSGRELPPVDRAMVVESRAAIARGEGEPVEDLLGRLGRDSE